MLRNEGGAGRRPLLATFVGNNRQMLQEIRDSLSHLRKQQQSGDTKSEPMQIKGDLASHTQSNLAERIPGAGGLKSKGFQYHQRALAEIKNSLRPFENNDPSQTVVNLNGLDGERPEIKEHMLRQLMSMGYDQVRTVPLFACFCSRI